jgi:hypothetical protein
MVSVADSLGRNVCFLDRNIQIIMFLGSKVRRVRRANKLAAIYEPIVF